VTIIADKAYQDASRRMADSAEETVVARFREVYGDRGPEILQRLTDRMTENIKSDNDMTLINASVGEKDR